MAKGAGRLPLFEYESVERVERSDCEDAEDAQAEVLSRKQIEDQLRQDEIAKKQEDAHLRSQVELKKFNHENANNFRFPPQDPLLDDLNPDNSPLKQITFNNKYYGDNRIVIDDQGNRIPDNRLVHEHKIEFGQLRSGSTFGGRMLVPFKFFYARMQNFFGDWAVERKFSRLANSEEIESIKDSETLQHHLQKSFFTIVADSANVEIWTLDRHCLVQVMEDSLFSDETQKAIYEEILDHTDADRGQYSDPDIEHIKQLGRKWDHYKQTMSFSVQKENQKKHHL